MSRRVAAGRAGETLAGLRRARGAFSAARQGRGERAVYVGAGARVRQLGGEYEDRARDRLHLLVVDLVGRVRGAVVVLVHAVEEEDDGDALARVVEVVAAVEEALGVVRLVVVVVVPDVEVRVVDGHVPRGQLVAHHARAYDVNLVRPRQHLVRGVRVAGLLAAADHVYVELRDHLLERHGREGREILRTPEALLLARVPDEQDRALRARPLREPLERLPRRRRL